MHIRRLAAATLLSAVAVAAAGCGGDTTTAIPETVTLEQEQQLREAQQSVDQEERAYRQSQGIR